MPVPLLIDTDLSLGTPNAEIDDAAALMLLAGSPEVEIRALTTVHGNAPEEIAAANLLRLAGFLDLSAVPLGRGAQLPLHADAGWSEFLLRWQAQYGRTPPVEAPLPQTDAVDLIIETAQRFPGDLVILALGPLTNLARALDRHPPLTGLVKAVYAMGGSLAENRGLEFNLRCDPEAAAAVLNAGWPIRLHGLEITRQVLFTPHDFAGLDPRRPAQELLQQQSIGWIRIVEAQGWEQGGCSLHDAVAAAAVIAPQLFRYVPARIDIETGSGARRGVSRVLPGGGPVQVAEWVDAAACKALILERIKE